MKKNNTIAITPKKLVLPPIKQKQLSEQLEGIFPDVDQTIQKQSETLKERIENVEELIDTFTKSNDYDADEQNVFEFESFTGGENQKFNSFVRKVGLTTENLKFLDFLQTDYCKEILISNDLKIHIETGIIYYNDTDTNESVFEFVKNQQDSSKGIINTDLKYEGSYKNYFQWILNGVEPYEKTKYDLLLFKNTKYLLYRFNDFQNSIGKSLIKVKHSVVTDNCITAEEIQNQKWQYFIERIIEVCHSKEVGSTIKSTENFLLTTVKNVTLAKKSYETFYNVIERNLYSTMSKISNDECEYLQEDFLSKNFWGENVVAQLDSWLAFYYKYVRFSGLQKYVSIPHVDILIFLKTEMSISPVDLYRKFAGTDAKALVSIHALVALNIHFGGNKYISQAALGEFLKNLTYQALSKENDEIFMLFNDIGLLVNDLLEQFVIKENAEIEKCSAISKEIRSKLKKDFEDSLSPEIKIQRREEEEEIIEPKPIEFSTLLKIEEINEIYDYDTKRRLFKNSFKT